MSEARTLVSTDRAVKPARARGYDEAWAEVQARVRALGGKAWRFRSQADPCRHVEFLEFAANSDPRRDPDVEIALGRLDPFGAGSTVEWTDASAER